MVLHYLHDGGVYYHYSSDKNIVFTPYAVWDSTVAPRSKLISDLPDFDNLFVGLPVLLRSELGVEPFEVTVSTLHAISVVLDRPGLVPIAYSARDWKEYVSRGLIMPHKPQNPPTTKKVSYPDKCKICGSPAKMLFTSALCSSNKCGSYDLAYASGR